MESTVKYSASFVQSLFIHVIVTGLQQESIRAKLRPLLERPSVNDEELMDKVNLAVSAETERQSKMGVSSKKIFKLIKCMILAVPLDLKAQKKRRKSGERMQAEQVSCGIRSNAV